MAIGDMQEIRQLLLIIFALTAIIPDVHAQRKKERHFQNAGEQEIDAAIDLFSADYQPQHHEKFTGVVTKIDETTFKFDSLTIKLYRDQPTLSLIFENKIWNPTGFGNTVIFFEEPGYLYVSSKVKRFKIVIGGRPMGGVTLANPFTFFFEVTNNKATRHSDIRTFMEGAELTFISRGWVML